jgi:U6 snRNA-associated Sm-like protein LSm6
MTSEAASTDPIAFNVAEDTKPTESPPPKKRSPSDFLKSVLGRPVQVKLNSGIEYRGILACLDGYLNIAMEQTEEYVDGQLQAKYGDCFIRGNNGKVKQCVIDFYRIANLILCVLPLLAHSTFHFHPKKMIEALR